MSLGPIEFLAIRFPGNQFRGEIMPALADLVEGNTIRIVRVIELADLGEDDYFAYEEIVSEVSGMLSHDDARQIASALEPNSSAALMLFENVWATRFVDAVANAKGEVILSERIPRAMIDEMLATAAAA
jgi:hypothetical protein